VLAQSLTSIRHDTARQEASLNDDPLNPVTDEPSKVTLDLDHEVQYWTAKWDVTHYALREAIAAVGPNATDVANALKARARLRRRAQRRAHARMLRD